MWTHPPLGLPYSPQTVLKGSFSPQTVGAGLHIETHIRHHDVVEMIKRSPLIDILDVRREHTRLHVCAASGEEDVVGVPIDGQDGRTDGLLEQAGHPPVALGVERADCDGAGRIRP